MERRGSRAFRPHLPSGTIFAVRSAVHKKEQVMTSKHDALHMPVSNWTLATGTRPGERHVYPTVRQSTARHAQPEARS
jgi:hypothetical protein